MCCSTLHISTINSQARNQNKCNENQIKLKP
uniref:Uncharacterized protein n=1 Tax=Arundo donax TaxID=35708 RepID=A0A0A9A049_ARUDO